MKRHTLTGIFWVSFLILSVVGCSPASDSGVGKATAVNSQKTFHWKLVTTWPKNLPGLGTGPEKMVKNIEAMSNGRLKIRVYGAGELVPAFGVFDAVMEGTAQMGHGAAYYWRGKLPVAAMFATVPFGLNAQEMNGWLHYGGGLELWQELYAPFDILPLAGGNSGVQMAGWFNKEINSLADIQGLKMRIPGLGGEVFQRAGGVAVAMPGGEVFTALQTGAIDATEWVGPYNDLALGLHTIAKYYYYPGWHEPGPTLETLVNKAAFNSLPSDLQAIVTTASRAMNADMLDEFTARNNTSLQTLIKEHGVKLRRLPDDVLARFSELSQVVVRENAQADDISRRIYESYNTFLGSMVDYEKVSEQAYLNARSKAAEVD